MNTIHSFIKKEHHTHFADDQTFVPNEFCTEEYMTELGLETYRRAREDAKNNRIKNTMVLDSLEICNSGFWHSDPKVGRPLTCLNTFHDKRAVGFVVLDALNIENVHTRTNLIRFMWVDMDDGVQTFFILTLSGSIYKILILKIS